MASFEGQIASLTTSLKDASEQQTDIQPIKEHVLAEQRRMHQLQMSIEEERCKILQIDSRLEEILDTTYFVDRCQDILEVLAGRIVWIETNKETPAEIPAKDRHSLKQDYDLLEFAINTVEEFKKTVRKTRGACTEYCRRVLVTYNRCQFAVEQSVEALTEHELLIEMLQIRYREDEQKLQQVKDLDEQILKDVIAHATVNIHFLED